MNHEESVRFLREHLGFALVAPHIREVCEGRYFVFDLPRPIWRAGGQHRRGLWQVTDDEQATDFALVPGLHRHVLDEHAVEDAESLRAAISTRYAALPELIQDVLAVGRALCSNDFWLSVRV